MSHDIVALLRAAHADPFSTDFDPRHLLLLAAEEIERLRRLSDRPQPIAQEGCLGG